MVDYKSKGFNPHAREGCNEDLFFGLFTKRGSF